MDVEVKEKIVTCTFTRMYLLDIWLSTTGNNLEKSRQVLVALTRTLPDAEGLNISNLDDRISYICKKFSEYWKQSSSSKTKLIAKHRDWMNIKEICELPLRHPEKHPQPHPEDDQVPSTSSGKHFKKDFADCSARSKRRRLSKLSTVDASAIAALVSNQANTSISQINTDDILSLIVEAKLTKHQYILIKDFVNLKIASNMFPSYNKVLTAKKKCYPVDTEVTEASAEVELQSLLDHTATRILESQKNVIANIPSESLEDMILIGKWGFDGSTGHGEYKQKFSDSSIRDDSLFVTSYVPLQLICKSKTSHPDLIVWKNPHSSSTRFCRVVCFQFAKETQDLSLQEEAYFEDKINNLQKTAFKYENDCEVRVQHSLQLSMVDGKVYCALTETASSTCYICKATPKEMNNIELCLSKPVDVDNFRFGLSPLHSWIRFFEYFIHVAYKLDIKKWQARSEEEKAFVAERKRRIQNDFREKLGLIVDKPRSGGSGTSNGGNTARKFFVKSLISAEITGINKDLIDRCCILLQCMSSGYKIDSVKFNSYALQTGKQLMQNYPWYYLPASVHKVLLHGSQVIEHALLPIGELSEEAAESSNKNIKLFRRDNTRKISRVTTNTDLLNRLLLHSDPFISSLRKLPKTKKSKLLPEVFELLQT